MVKPNLTPNLFTTYLDLKSQTEGLTEKQAVMVLCEQTRRRYSNAYASEWASGNRSIPTDVLRLLVRIVYPYVQSLDCSQDERIERLSPPALSPTRPSVRRG